ncbi:hypothetical protein FRC01_001145, partial [Tulasnella sp. 417]
KEVPSPLSEAEGSLSTSRAIRSVTVRIPFSALGERTARQPITQLPNEVLHEILQSALDYDRTGYTRRPTTYFARQQALRRVSSHWNQVISSSPFFWNTLCCVDTRRKRFKIALEKSGNVGLHVICRSGAHCRRFAERMSEVSQRWASLDILYDIYWEDHIPLSAPMLNSIIINGQTMQLPPLPTRYAQGLSIVLSRVNDFTWDIAPLTGLRALELTAVDPTPKLGQLLDIMAANPCLERFSMSDKYLNPDPEANLRMITMPNLRYIGCPTTATSEGLIDLITHLAVQSDCRLNLRMYAGEIVPDLSKLIGKLFGYLRERINRLDPTFSVGLHLDSGSWSGMVLECPSANPVIFVRFSWWVDKFPVEQGIRDIVEELEPVFRCARELRFSGEEFVMYRASWSLLELSELFAQRLLHLSRLAVPSAPWALEYLKNPKPDHGWVSPNLRHLRLLGGGWQPNLLELLENRRHEPAVKTIERIILENIDVEPQDLQALKELVSEVVVEMPI